MVSLAASRCFSQLASTSPYLSFGPALVTFTTVSYQPCEPPIGSTTVGMMAFGCTPRSSHHTLFRSASSCAPNSTAAFSLSFSVARRPYSPQDLAFRLVADFPPAAQSAVPLDQPLGGVAAGLGRRVLLDDE